MESQKRNLRVRKPLADCTNTVLSSQSSASNLSAAIKPRKRVVKSAVKDVLNNEKEGVSSFASASTSVNLQASNPSSEFLPTQPSSNLPPAESNPSSDSLPTEPSSSSVPAEVSTPSRLVDLPSSSDRVPEPQSFYSRRHPANRRKSTETAAAPFIFSTASKILTRGEKRAADSSPSRARTVPYRKRQRGAIYGEDESKIELPREFVEKQKAYFSEVDAFELLVEEAKSSDSE
ncbi:uncharacterized protein LOC111779162 isoform X2 [Cucurbita pepo subsp. pepo]|uniref:uncharacterized protein LOC111779162 isoform X2 n=1 Tax=Cucurbita pepo subsp. pepo TaxID=3664 RepID=UPI000C9D8DDD|nr:uncharacterized protein LOC111779162 isoform X2 [Cucurbita pepo subsp. pepo]